MMVDDILQLAHNQQFLERITNGLQGGGNIELLKKLPKYEDLKNLERRLRQENKLNFNVVFNEPVGNYLIRTYLVTEHSVDKAIFVSDVALFKKLNDQSGRRRVSEKIFYRFCAPEAEDHLEGVSVFSNPEDDLPWYAHRKSTFMSLSEDSSGHSTTLSLLTEGTNTIGVYGKPIRVVKHCIDSNETDNDKLFDPILQEVLDDLRLDVFPRFCRSNYYKMYIRCKAVEDNKITVRDFLQLRPLGKGAFGLVYAGEKRDCGRLYAMKQISKRRVQATKSLKTVMQERDYLALMNSNFVTSLKYAIVDEDTIYIILDLMLGGDLKYHLNAMEKFSEDRARFHAAQILLGLEHIHSKGIVYRDLKLENVLVDENGHVKISDLGLAVSIGKDGKGTVRGYAGTPGYTAPEVVLGFQYNHIADFFSLGVMVYRCLCGKKPFEKRKHNRRGKGRHDARHRKSSQLDRNVIEMEPEFSPQYFTASARSILKGLMAKNPKRRLGSLGIHEIKQHPWFEKIDFGLLEAGYLKPPFEPPKLDQVHSPIQGGNDTAPKQDKEFAEVKLTDEFEEELKKFEFISKETLQDELVEVLRRADIEKRKNMDVNATDMGEMGSLYKDLEPGRDNRCLACNII